MPDSSLETPEQVSRSNSARGMFSPGSPDFGIGGIDVLRATIVASESEEEDSIRWHVSTLPSGDESPPLTVLGDLVVVQAGWFVGVTIMFLIGARDDSLIPDIEDEDGLNKLGQMLGPWVSHALYDVAAMVARQLVAAAFECDVDVPRETPETHVTRVRRRAEGDPDSE